MDESFKEPTGPLKKYLDQVTPDAVAKILRPLSTDKIMKEIAEEEHREARQMYLDARIPSEHFSEIRELVDEKILHRLMAELNITKIESSKDALEYVKLAAEIQEIDPEWFADHYKENVGILNDLIGCIYIIKEDPLRFLEYANNFKTFNPEYYVKRKELIIEDTIWDKIAEKIKREAEEDYVDEFIINYARAAYLDYGEISKRIKVEDYWSLFIQKLKSYIRNPVGCARIVAASQTIRPHEVSEVLFKKESWLACKRDLMAVSSTYKNTRELRTLRLLTEQIRALKYLEVEN